MNILVCGEALVDLVPAADGLLAPKLGEVFGSWETLGTIHPLWIVAMIAADAASFWFVSLFTLSR